MEDNEHLVGQKVIAKQHEFYSQYTESLEQMIGLRVGYLQDPN